MQMYKNMSPEEFWVVTMPQKIKQIAKHYLLNWLLCFASHMNVKELFNKGIF